MERSVCPQKKVLEMFVLKSLRHVIARIIWQFGVTVALRLQLQQLCW